jgi:porphobilinogen synthase
MAFPVERPRRLRRSPAIRALVRETALRPGDLILPLFFSATLAEPRPIASMPGVFQLPVSAAAEQARQALALGLGGVLLFGLPAHKDTRGECGADPNGPVPRAIAAMKDAAPGLLVMADVCVDEYTEHGHCGVLHTRPDGSRDVDNDATLEILARIALAYAAAGADVVAPSDMMDGRVGVLRGALDRSGHREVSILSYAVKYASAFYGPFRDAADCAPQFGDRASYQMDPANAREALREVRLDEEEGADMLMVKPALAYLDVIRAVRAASPLPLGAYNVSGEYAMIKAAAAAGMIDERKAMMEVLTSIRRAGADFLLTYHATDAAKLLGLPAACGAPPRGGRLRGVHLRRLHRVQPSRGLPRGRAGADRRRREGLRDLRRGWPAPQLQRRHPVPDLSPARRPPPAGAALGLLQPDRRQGRQRGPARREHARDPRRQRRVHPRPQR